eukprot:scaffold246216_cov52-Prasinocladus_malaysianus.AAC.1
MHACICSWRLCRSPLLSSSLSTRSTPLAIADERRSPSAPAKARPMDPAGHTPSQLITEPKLPRRGSMEDLKSPSLAPNANQRQQQTDAFGSARGPRHSEEPCSAKQQAAGKQQNNLSVQQLRDIIEDVFHSKVKANETMPHTSRLNWVAKRIGFDVMLYIRSEWIDD